MEINIQALNKKNGVRVHLGVLCGPDCHYGGERAWKSWVSPGLSKGLVSEPGTANTLHGNFCSPGNPSDCLKMEKSKPGAES